MNKTEIRVEIHAPDAELVSRLRDDLETVINQRTSRLITKNKGKLVAFSIRTCAAIPEDMEYPFDRLEPAADRVHQARD